MQGFDTSRPSGTTNQEVQQLDPERAQRRREILDAARALFIQKGYEATTMAEIARASYLAVGTLYKFFRDKRHLYQTLVAETMHDFERRLTGVLRQPDVDEIARLERYLELGTELFQKHFPLVRVYFSDSSAAFLHLTVGLEDEAFLSYRRMVGVLEETFRSGIEKGLFIDLDPAVLAMGLEGVHNAFLAALVREPQSFTPQQIVANTKRMFFDAVVRR
jgi:AcrR family transcriptional regulator